MILSFLSRKKSIVSVEYELLYFRGYFQVQVIGPGKFCPQKIFRADGVEISESII